jgi:hypothetical protein
MATNGNGNGNGEDATTISGGTIWHVLTALVTPGALAPLWWGPPGIGKTSMIERAADVLREKNGWSEDQFPVEVMIAALCDPTDFRGLPIPTANGTRFEPPEEAVRLARALRGWLFLDEVGNAVPATQSALLRVVHKRVMGLLALPDEVKIVAAANPPEEAAGGWEQAAGRTSSPPTPTWPTRPNGSTGSCTASRSRTPCRTSTPRGGRRSTRTSRPSRRPSSAATRRP